MTQTRSTLTLVLTLAFASTLIGRATTPAPTKRQPVPSAAAVERIKRGEYLVATSGCHDCHSPKLDAQMTVDESRPLSGRPATTVPPQQGTGEARASLDFTAWSGPWGISYAANITPDRETGIGARYTEAAFIRTIRTGRKPEGEPLLPPMPWPAFKNMTDDDLKAIYAYLMTLNPVKNFVRASPVVTASSR
jgi:mono/diheme cytochrome c family protein